MQPSGIYGIPAGDSDSVIFTLNFRGDAIPGKKYDWMYEITSDAAKVTIPLSAKATIIDFSKIMSELESMKNTGVTEKYSSTGDIIANSINMLNSAAKVGALAAEDGVM